MSKEEASVGLNTTGEGEEWTPKLVSYCTPTATPRGKLTSREYLENMNCDKKLSKQICAIDKATERESCLIPNWLQLSELYKESLNMGVEICRDSFSEESRFIRENSDIASMSDFEEVMQCIDYWGVEFWPDSAYSFIWSNTADVLKWRNASAMSVAQSLDLSDMFLLCMVKSDGNLFMKEVCKAGSIGWLKYGLREFEDLKLQELCCEAAAGGHLSCLKYAHENGCSWGSYTCSFAAAGGHLSCLKYAHENGCSWGSYTCLKAAAGGHLSCLKYAHENGCL
jgi:hypothetical protein